MKTKMVFARHRLIHFSLAVIVFMCAETLRAQQPQTLSSTDTLMRGNAAPAQDPAQVRDTVQQREFTQSLDFCPMSPLFRIYAIHYCRKVTPNSEIIIGPYYANIEYKDIGHTDAPGFIVGYRQYLWRSLHIDYQLMPQWDHYYEMNEKKRYPLGFDLWNEFRLGYVWDFNVGSLPAFINVQWPFGFALYSDDNGKPESFKKHAKENPLFYYPPMFFLGIRF